MDFIWPGFLALLIAIPLLVAAYVWAQRRRSRFALRYSSLSVVKDALGKGPGLRRHIPPLFFFLSIAAMLLAVARPVAVVTLPAQDATVILAIDVSRSMRANDIQPDRLDAAKAAAELFVQEQRPNTRIGVVSFSATAALVQEPTTDREAVLASIDRLALGSRTAIGSGILTSLNAIFEKLDANESAASPDLAAPTPTPVPDGFHVPAIIILLTDGRSNTGPLPLESAQMAANRGVRVFTVGIGTTQGTIIPGGNPGGGRFGGGGFAFRADLDETTLQEIAQITDAKYFHASEAEELASIYQGLDTQLIVQTQRTELTVFFTAGAALFLLIGGTLSLLWFNRLP
ncbi:MAG: VWA domain-containing protein [Chloroflexota bacterium]|nr:VWA domain-containing protein [Chloroflexota bacterium]